MRSNASMEIHHTATSPIHSTNSFTSSSRPEPGMRHIAADMTNSRPHSQVGMLCRHVIRPESKQSSNQEALQC